MFAADRSSLISAMRACCSGVPLFLRAMYTDDEEVLKTAEKVAFLSMEKNAVKKADDFVKSVEEHMNNN